MINSLGSRARPAGNAGDDPPNPKAWGQQWSAHGWRAYFGPLIIATVPAVAGWIIIFCAIRPAAQDFPLGDDWAYSCGAIQFAQGKGIHYFHWAAMPQLGQWLWACPFIVWFGPTLVGLRVSTICLGFAGVGAFYDLVRQAGVSLREAGLAAATLALNPFFVLLQGSFMTEIPALSFGLMALALYGRGLEGRGWPFWVSAATMATLAICTRQNMLTVAPAAGLLLWRCPRPGRMIGALSVLLPVVLGLGTHFWFENRLDVQHLKLMHPAFERAPLIAFIIIHTGGLAIAPMIALAPRPRSLKRFLVVSLAMAAVAYYWWTRKTELSFDGLFPYAKGLVGYGGPYTGIMAGHMEAWLPTTGALLLTIGGCLGGAWLIDRALERLPWALANPLVLYAMLQLPLMLIIRGIYDRYMFMVLPAVLLLALPVDHGRPRWRYLPAAATLGIVGIISFGLMHDCLSWNSARWALGHRAVARSGREPWRIEGGLEWNGWNYLQHPPPASQRPPRRALVMASTRVFFPGVTGEWALAFWPLPDQEVLDREYYQRWLPPRREQFHLIVQKAKTNRPAH